MRKSELRERIIALLSDKINENPCYSLESYALYSLREKFIDKTITLEERSLLIGDFLSNYLEFDSATDAPIGNTLIIEEMIDYVLSEDCIAK